LDRRPGRLRWKKWPGLRLRRWRNRLRSRPALAIRLTPCGPLRLSPLSSPVTHRGGKVGRLAQGFPIDPEASRGRHLKADDQVRIVAHLLRGWQPWGRRSRWSGRRPMGGRGRRCPEHGLGEGRPQVARGWRAGRWHRCRNRRRFSAGAKRRRARRWRHAKQRLLRGLRAFSQGYSGLGADAQACDVVLSAVDANAHGLACDLSPNRRYPPGAVGDRRCPGCVIEVPFVSVGRRGANFQIPRGWSIEYS
jgi:hypothetical protein